MQKIKCLIHDQEFSFPDKKPPDSTEEGGTIYYLECPWCLEEKYQTLRREYKKVLAQRNDLLKAIEIKSTLQVSS